MAFPHLQQPSFLLVSIRCPCECPRDGSSKQGDSRVLSTGLNSAVVVWGTCDGSSATLRVEILRLPLPLPDLCPAESWFSPLQGGLIQMPFSPASWGMRRSSDSKGCTFEFLSIVKSYTKE